MPNAGKAIGPDASSGVLHIITRMDAGGAAMNTLISVDRLRQHGFRTVLAYGCTADRSLLDGLSACGVPAFGVPSLVRRVAPLRDLVALRDLLRVVRHGEYRLIHTHCSKAGALGRIVAWCCRLPAIHTPHGHVFYGYFGRVPTAFFVTAERALARITDRLVSLTDIETEEALQHRIGRRRQYVTIPSGVDLSSFRGIPAETGVTFRHRLDIPGDAFVLGAAGRLVPVKGVDLLIRAFAQASWSDRRAYLVVGGDGEERGRLEQLACELGVAAHVRFAGFLEDVRPMLGALDVFVLPSRNEGMGRSLVEAMTAGLPVIATDAGGIPALVENGKTGLLVPRDDAPALARAMVRLAQYPAERAALGTAAARHVFPEYDVSTMTARLADLYHAVLHG